ncbi:LOB domain-containing protein 1-like [Fagus crenata]
MEIKGKTTTAAPPEVTVPTPYYSYSPSTTTTTSLSPAAAQSSPSFPSPPSQSPPSPSAPHSPPPIVLSPCAACKILRRRCVDKCILAPYFPPTHPLKFTIAHRVFGASNIIKLLQELPESQRADAVSSMVYEANARIRDPVYGCAGAICQLQNQLSELQAELARAQAEIVNMQCQQANLVLLCMEMTQSQEYSSQQQQPHADTSCFLDDSTLGSAWEPLWT